jgi:hypothetical protein
MLWLTLTMLGLAIALWRYSHRRTDDVMKFLALSFALISLMTGLAVAPGPMKFLLLAGLLICPTCASAERAMKADCPRYCLMQHQCAPKRGRS